MPAPGLCHPVGMSTRYPIVQGFLVCLTLGLGLPAGAADDLAGVSEESYADFMENEVLDIEDLADGAEVQREYFNRITPPGVSLFQPMLPPVAPFDEAYFDKDFLAGLLGEYQFSVAVFPLILVLDPKTRETLIYNAEDDLIATVPGDGTPRTWPEDADPARITLSLDLLSVEDVEPYLYVEDRISQEAEAANFDMSGMSLPPGEMSMLSLEADQIGFADIQSLTNGNMLVTVTNGTNAAAVAELFSYTVWHSSTVQYGSTGEAVVVWSLASPSYNGLDNALTSPWEYRATNLVFTNHLVVWEDSSVPTNARQRVYGAAIRTNSDADTLTDGAELFVYHTDPADSDTDNDWVDDGAEVDIGTVPTQSNEVVQIWIQFPENGRQVP